MSKKSSVITEPEVLVEEIKMSKREKIGVLGGTFNPPHMGHLIIADQVRDQLDLDKILFMPTAQPPHSSSEKKTISSNKRVHMLDLALMDDSDFEIELFDFGAKGAKFCPGLLKEVDFKGTQSYHDKTKPTAQSGIFFHPCGKVPDGNTGIKHNETGFLDSLSGDFNNFFTSHFYSP